MPATNSHARPALVHTVPVPTAVTIRLILAAILVTAITTPALARQETGSTSAVAEERRQRIEERRQKREQAVAERRARQSDPEYVQQQAWWNDERHVEAFGLTAAQRKQADDALALFLIRREEATEASRDAQQAFLDAVAGGTADIPAKKKQMLESKGAVDAANADLRIAVFGTLTPAQRARIQEEQPRLLRSDWADSRRRASDRRLKRQRERGTSDDGSRR